MKTNNHPQIRLYWGENYAPKPKAVTHKIAAIFSQVYRDLHLYPGSWQDKTIAAISQEYH